jgi:hypothetical protein
MNKAISTIANVVGAATLLLVGYAIVASLPDLRHYIRLSTM